MKPALSRSHPYYLQLQHDLPDIQLQSVSEIGQGWDNVALEVNDEYIFRLPKDREDTKELQQVVGYETAVLKRLAGKLPVAIPFPEFIASDTTYYGYKKLAGHRADTRWGSLSADQKSAFFDTWVNTQVQIEKTISLKEAQALQVAPCWLGYMLDEAEKLLQLRSITKECRAFTEYALVRAKSLSVSKDALFLHNDFYLHNILVDDNNQMSALLDWSDCCIAPIERQFSFWYRQPQPEFAELVQKYTAQSGRAVDIETVASWQYIETCSDLYEQLESGDEIGANESLTFIHRWVLDNNL